MLAPKVARIFPRKRRGENEDEGKKEIVLTAVEITNLFHLRQSEAATQLVFLLCPSIILFPFPSLPSPPLSSLLPLSLLTSSPASSPPPLFPFDGCLLPNSPWFLQGISLTALKNACKQVGINNWPYPRSKKEEETRGTTAELFFMKDDARKLPEDAPTLVRREVVAGVGAGVVAAPQLSLLPGTSLDHLVPRVEGGMGRAKRSALDWGRQMGDGEHAEVEWGRNRAAGMEKELRVTEGKERLWYFGSGRRIHDMQVLSLLDDAFSCVVDHSEREETSPRDRADVM